MPKDALLEIGCEELPSNYVSLGIKQLVENVPKVLSEYSLSFANVDVWGSPRRLAVYIGGLVEKQKDTVKEIIGPKTSIAYDTQGNPTPALLGFAKSQGVKIEDVKKKETNRGAVVVAEQKLKGQATEILLTYIFPKIILSLNFPKTMTWENSRFLFPRPIRWLLGLYGQKKIQFSLAAVKSSNFTYGLFPLMSKRIVIPFPVRYLPVLRNNYVLVNPEERKQAIKKGAAQLVKKIGGKILEDAELLSEIVNLVEYPTPILGKFGSEFLKLPQEVVITCLKKKQKYFSIVDTEGKLLPYFIGIRNGASEYQDVVRNGYERVLTARLDDAQFFFDRDHRLPLAERVESLKGIIFQEQLGSLYDKVQRVIALSEYIFGRTIPSPLVPASPVGGGEGKGEGERIKRTALLCKADLLTEMVGEFPELQGVMGRIYVQLNGEAETVALGIEEHLWPSGANGKSPRTVEGIVVSIADKIDTLTGDFSVGLIPTGSADPYGLRRLAMGVVKIILEKGIQLSLEELIAKALTLLPVAMNDAERNNAKNNLLNFFNQRLETFFLEQNFAYDEIRAVLVVGFSDLVQTKMRLEALHSLRNHPDFEPISVAFKRTVNILKQAREKKLLNSINFQPATLVQEAEKLLYEQFTKIARTIPQSMANKDFKSVLQQLVSLRLPVDKFFEKVMVMVEDESLRSNRLALLEKIAHLFFQFADFSQIVVKGEEL